MNRGLSPRVVGRAFATLFHELPAELRPSALRACARYLQRARLLSRAAEVLDPMERQLLALIGKKRADIESAHSLKRETVQRLERILTKIVGVPVDARVRVRPRLLAGFRAEVDGQRVDASVRGHLSRLSAQVRAAVS